MYLACAAKHLCGMKKTPLTTSFVIHYCMNCEEAMHGALCGCLFSERPDDIVIEYDDLTDNGKRRFDQGTALICAYCIAKITGNEEALLAPTDPDPSDDDEYLPPPGG